MGKLSQLESIGVKFVDLLQNVGIEDQEQLLNACRQQSGRNKLAQQTGINYKLIKKWSVHADLARVHGIGADYAELLEYRGIESVQQLSQWNAEKLLHSLHQVNKQINLVRQLPTTVQLQSWIEQAKKLPALLA